MESIPSYARGFILDYYESLDCPRSLTCWLLFNYNEHDQLVQLSFNPKDYRLPGTARDSLAATKFLSKATFLSTSVDKRKVAMDSFFEAERQCLETNKKLLRNEFKNTHTSSILTRMGFKINSILNEFNIEDFVDRCNWGPGASTSIKKRNATHPTKFQTASEITLEAYEFVAPWFKLVYPNWEPEFKIVKASKLVTVPKSAKTDRTIAIEPDINLWFQKGVGSMLRSKLKKVGIDLNTQTINGNKARLGSKFNTLATVDFSAASDTISKELVSQLFPYEWRCVLEAFRSSFCSVDGKLIYLNKFSSMGNGFTFELESLIFYALAFAVCEHLSLDTSEISVFGDDVILPVEAFDLFRSISDDIGFSVNFSKSYFDSYYRESCGDHWWNGYNIKPIFQKDPLNEKSAILRFANAIRRYAHRRNSYGCDNTLRLCWQNIVRFLGDSTPRISEGYGDLGIVDNFDDSKAYVTRAKHGIEGYFVRVWAVQAAKISLDCHGLQLAKLKMIGNRRDADSFQRLLESYYDSRIKGIGFNITELAGGGNDIPLPGRTKHAKLRVLVPRWYDLGPWI